MAFRHLCLAALLGILGAAPAAAGTVEGHARDARTGAPLARVAVELVGTAHRATTAAGGRFGLPEVPPGGYRLRARHPGYAERELAVEVDDGVTAVELALDASRPRVGETLTVTAQRDERRAFDVPESVSTLEPDQLARRSLRSTPEALVGMTGVFLQKTNHGAGSPFVRGLTGNQVLQMVDGIRLNNATFRYGPNQYLATVAPYSIERIEVLRGAGSTLYGSDAIGGVVNVLSRGPGFSGGGARASGRVLLQAMSGGMERSARAEAEAAGPRWALYAGADARRFGDLVAGGDLGVEAPSGYDEASADVKGLLRPSARTLLTLAYQHVRLEDVPRWDQVTQRGYLRYAFDPQVRQLAYARSQTFLDSPWLRRIEATVSFQRSLEGRLRQRRGETTVARERDTVDTVGAQLEARSEPRPGWRATTGIELYHDRVASSAEAVDLATGAVAPRRGLYPDGATAASLAAFTLHSLALGRLELSLGARFNSFALAADDPVVGRIDVKPEAFVGSAAVLYRLAERHHLVASVQSGFRAPNISDIASLGPFDFGVEVPSPELQPERSLTLELGYKARSGRLASAVAAYTTRLSDLIDRVPSTYQGAPTLDGDPVYRKQNVGRARLYGVEAEAELALARSATLAAGLVYTYGQNIDAGEPMRRIPPLHGRIALGAAPLGVAVDVELLWAARQDRLASGDRADHRIDPDGTPGWNVLNLRLARDTGRLRLRGGLDNLFDEAYRTHGSGIDGQGRAVWLAVEARF
jgi:outer membrane receptor protein involved in Fe transport